MVINVRQTKANIKQEFDVYYNGVLRFVGKLSTASSVLPSSLYKLDGGIQLQSKRKIESIISDKITKHLFTVGIILLFIIRTNDIVKILGAISLFFLLNMIPKISKLSDIINSCDELVARFCRVRKSFLNVYYSTRYNNKEYFFYIVSRSHYQHISIYLDDKQIAQVDKDLHTVNRKDAYTLYLLDTEAAMADLFTLFILYFDNYNHTSRDSVFIGMRWKWSWTIGPINRFYNKEWLTAHFDKS